MGCAPRDIVRNNKRFKERALPVFLQVGSFSIFCVLKALGS